MRPEPGQVLHFSEDPTITRFVPRVAPTARQPDAYVWAVDDLCAPDYWFPRDCPRVLAWMLPTSSAADRERILGPGGGERVHAIEYRWVADFLGVELYAYRFAAEGFTPFGAPTPSAVVSVEPVEPLGPPEPVGDLLALHEAAGIQLRILDNLWDLWDGVVASSLGFSGIRLRNAADRPAVGAPDGRTSTPRATES